MEVIILFRIFAPENEMMKMNTASKLIQALNYIANSQQGKSVGFMKAYKLLWLIDRYSLRHYARTVSGDQYFAMKFGPVPTDAKHILEGIPTNMEMLDSELEQYISINEERHIYKSIKAPEMGVFSVSDIKAMDLILQKYGSMRSTDLSTMSHKFPEWKAYERRLVNTDKKDSYPIKPCLFFEVYDDGKGVFNEDPKLLEMAKEMYNEYNSLV